MIAPLKYSLYNILYHAGDNGIWEYDIYELLKPVYNKAALVKIRSLLVELSTKAWTDEVESILWNDQIIRRYKLQPRHRKFIEYMLPNSDAMLREIGIQPESLGAGKVG